MKPDILRWHIVTALKSGWMKQASVARRAGVSRQRINKIATTEGIDADRAYEARQDKIWEEIKRKGPPK